MTQNPSLKQCISIGYSGTSPRTRGAVQAEAYLHRSRKPLDRVDFSEVVGYSELMGEECEGLCGI